MIELENITQTLTVDNASGFEGKEWEYPVYRFKQGTKTSFTIGPKSMCPEGYTPEVLYESLEDNFNKYVKEIIEEYEPFDDKKLMELSFIGFKRSARLNDEKRRRGLLRSG